MLDQMSMPVLFVLVFVLLAVAAGGLLVAIRVLGARQRLREKQPPAPRP